MNSTDTDSTVRAAKHETSTAVSRAREKMSSGVIGTHVAVVPLLEHTPYRDWPVQPKGKGTQGAPARPVLADRPCAQALVFTTHREVEGMSVSYADVEGVVQRSAEWLRLLVETLGALVIAVGIGVAVFGLFRHALMSAARVSRPSASPSRAS
ncbi:hypothetical protein [Azohydromonas australica]|uniref:hypothetical protein n=1 Tax=Azohydromonas australica TaxID=364039 RepID=UPI001EE3A9D2|nr:hypothetical protein [Azohydromonas australica]